MYQMMFLQFDFIRSMSLQLSTMQFKPGREIGQILVCTLFKIREQSRYGPEHNHEPEVPDSRLETAVG
jgi:hypothetical protein